MVLYILVWTRQMYNIVGWVWASSTVHCGIELLYGFKAYITVQCCNALLVKCQIRARKPWLNKVYCLQKYSLSLLQRITWHGMVPHTGTIYPTDLSTAALANCKLSLNTAWLAMHSPYVSLHIPAMEWNFCCLLFSACLHNPVIVLYTYSRFSRSSYLSQISLPT